MTHYGSLYLCPGYCLACIHSFALLFVLFKKKKINTTCLNSSTPVNLRMHSCEAVTHSSNWLWWTFLSVFYSATHCCQGLITPPPLCVSNWDLNHGCRRTGEQDVCSWKHTLFYRHCRTVHRLIVQSLQSRLKSPGGCLITECVIAFSWMQLFDYVLNDI